MFNPSLLLVSALFFLALVSVLYVGAWLATNALSRRASRSHAKAKRVWMTALVLPPLLALVPTALGATMRHLHDAAVLPHHNPGCRVVFTRLSALGNLGGGETLGTFVSAAAWLLVLTGVFLLFRLVRATRRLEQGIAPFLRPPSPRLVRALERVAPALPGLPVGRFFECPLPAAYSSVLGFWRARCVLSQEFVAHTTEEELDAVVAHEGSHLRGRDVFATFLVGALNCLFFFLRPVRLLGRAWREAAELAADDAAVAATKRPLAMASAILKASGVPVGVANVALPTVAIPFADEAACPPAKRVERLLAQAQHASLAPIVEGRAQVLGGWLATGVFAGIGAALLLSAEAACLSHCSLELVGRLLGT